jgi:uncharacterized protein YjiS (DUF1127 family)
MNAINQAAGFGTLFSTLAALTSPGQEFVTPRPAYRGVPGRRTEAGGRLKALLAGFRQRQEQARTMRALERLDDRLLRDIGITRAEVNAGLLPPFARPEDPALRGLGRDLAGRW